MTTSKHIYLSYILDSATPTYGNRNTFLLEKKSDIAKGDIANDSHINTTVHIGTHIDMPYHFFKDGQTIKDFDIDYFRFKHILYIDMLPKDNIIKDELITILSKIDNKDHYDILLVKTGICHQRDKELFWKENYGFDPILADYLREHFPHIRVLGFDTISVSSFSNRLLGREAHKAFLDPRQPILLLEDMDLTSLHTNSIIQALEIVPLRIADSDGLPCTIIAKVQD